MTTLPVIIMGGRRQGKTEQLIRHSAETGIYILVTDRPRAHQIVQQAVQLGITNLPFPVTVEDFYHSPNKFAGSSILKQGLLVDDMDEVLAALLQPIEIKAATLNSDDVEWSSKFPIN